MLWEFDRTKNWIQLLLYHFSCLISEFTRLRAEIEQRDYTANRNNIELVGLVEEFVREWGR